MGPVIEGKPGRMVEVRLVQGKTQTVKTVLPVTVRDARREATHIAWIAKAATLVILRQAAYTILLLGLLAILATLCNYRNTRIENRRLKMEVRKLEQKKAVLERYSRTWLRREQLAEAITFLETDLEPFLGMEEEVMEEEEEEETTWFFFFPPPVVFRLDIVRVMDELDLEIYNNSRIIEETETIEETEVINLNVGLQETR